jgi:hypothetical protein
MNQIDWVGSTAKKSSAFKDIKNQGSKTAEQKARLCHEIGALTNRVPPSIMAAGIEKTREWVAAREASAKVVANQRSSINALQIALKRMQAFK